MLAIALAAALAAVPCPTPHRSRGAVEAFKKSHPCPTSCATYVRKGSRFALYQKCGACQVDHICPLACCGIDAPQNMQWLPSRANSAKGADCSACGLPKQ